MKSNCQKYMIKIILTLISIVHIQSLLEFDPNGTDQEKNTKCLKAVDILVSGNTYFENCVMCRADKDKNGKILQDNNQQLEGKIKGTYALRINKLKDRNPFECNKDANEDNGKQLYDQEFRISLCELQDNYGLCIRCIVGYGLKWQDSIGEQGGYKCVENDPRTVFCNKYDQNDQCIECKWNQDPEQADVFKIRNGDQSYELDFGLYLFQGQQYCINNRDTDNQGTDFKDENRTDHCAQYDSNSKCIRCHTRKFDLEGQVWWQNQDPKQTETIDYLLSKDDNKQVCKKYPNNYQTDPNDLEQFSLISQSISPDSKCKEGLSLHVVDGVRFPSYYGCGKNINGCKTYGFQWDHEYFNKTGKFRKYQEKCIECEGTYYLNAQTNTCTEEGVSTEFCIQIDNNSNCLSCESPAKLAFDEDSKTVSCYQTAPYPSSLSNCGIKFLHKVNGGSFITVCTQCDGGFILKKDKNGRYNLCQQKNYELPFGCYRLDNDNNCIEGGILGWEGMKNSCQLGTTNISRELCIQDKPLKEELKINHCLQYIWSITGSTCIKCQDQYFLNYSGQRCILEQQQIAKETIENCKTQIGGWCQKCYRKGENGLEHDYVLTDQNRCVKEKSDDLNCLFRVIISLGNCALCNNGFIKDKGLCVIDPEYQISQSNNIIYTLENRLSPVEGQKVDKCKIHKDLNGNCYECDYINGNLYGVSEDHKQCVQCNPGQFIQQIDGYLVCSNEKQLFNNEHCYIKDEKGNCLKCENGYQLTTQPKDKQKFVQCTPNHSTGCLLLKYLGFKECLQCQRPYILVGKVCVLPIENCINQTKEDYCQLCDPGYQYIGHIKKCVLKPPLCQSIDFQKSYDQTTLQLKSYVCSQCDTKDMIRLTTFGDSNQLIYTCMQGCQNLYRRMQKRSNDNPYNLFQCASCRNDLYYWNIESNECIRVDRINTCEKYVDQINNFDQKCEKCQLRQYLQPDQKDCLPCDPTSNCSQTDQVATELINDKCKCKVCNSGYYVDNKGECQQAKIKFCLSYDGQGKCQKCERYYLLDIENNGCFTYKAMCGDSENRHPSKDKCIRCGSRDKTANLFDPETELCIAGQINKCLTYIDAKQCQQCENGYGLLYDRSGCISNSLKNENKQGGQQNCKHYSNQIFQDENVCIECDYGYALDFTLHDLKKQCLKVNYCEQAIFKENVDESNNKQHFCKKCMIRDDVSQKRVFRINSDYKSNCRLEEENNKSTNYIKFCKIYKSFTGSINDVCQQCHDGFSSDWNGDSQSSVCVSDDNPGAIPGCSKYDLINKGQTGSKYSKYENLTCRVCENYWRYYGFQDSTVQKYTYNTFFRECDITENINLSIIASNIWNGKDGGIRHKSQDSDNQTDPQIDINGNNDREFYQDPLLKGFLLQFNIWVLICILICY